AAGDGLIIQVLKRIDRGSAYARIVLDQQDPGTGDVHVRIGAVNGGMDAGMRGGFGARQVDRYDRAASDLALNPHLAAGLMREAEDLAEAETGALANGFRGEEGLERAF